MLFRSWLFFRSCWVWLASGLYLFTTIADWLVVWAHTRLNGRTAERLLFALRIRRGIELVVPWTHELCGVPLHRLIPTVAKDAMKRIIGSDFSAAPALNRRAWFQSMAGGVYGAALANLLGPEILRAESGPALAMGNRLAPRAPHFPAKARSVILHSWCSHRHGTVGCFCHAMRKTRCGWAAGQNFVRIGLMPA